MNKAALVTGAQGFIGSWLCQRLLHEGYRVRGLVRRDANLPGVELVKGDITDPAAGQQATEGMDVVVHCAANFGMDFDEATRVNVDGTRLLAEAALEHGCERFIHISTCGVYNLVGVEVVEETTAMWDYDPKTSLVYGTTKAEAERAVMKLMERGLKAVILRPPNVLGADVLNPYAYEIALRIKEGKLELGGSGDNTWPYVHIENLLDAILLAIHHPRAVGEVYTVVDGYTTWGEYTGTFADWLGAQLPTRAKREPYDTFYGRFSTEKIQRELGYSPKATLEDAITDTRRLLMDKAII